MSDSTKEFSIDPSHFQYWKWKQLTDNQKLSYMVNFKDHKLWSANSHVSFSTEDGIREGQWKKTALSRTINVKYI